MRKLFFLLTIALAAPAVWAQASDAAAGGQVTGIVRSASGQALGRADIVLVDASLGRPVYGAASDDVGEFRLAGVRFGRYTLQASYVGYERWSRSIEVGRAEGEPIEVVLRPRALPQPEVIITAHRARPGLTPVTAANMDRVELDRRPRMKDLPAQLATLPSMTYYSENGNGVGYSYLRMRGFDQRRIAVAINGIPQNDPEEFNVFWINFFDLQGAIEDIQVQRGAGSAFYGPAAIGGAINIQAKPYKPYPYATIDAGYGAYATRRVAVALNSGLIAGRWVAFGRGSRMLSDGYRDWSWSEFWRFFGGVTRYGDRSSFTVQAYGGPQEDALAYIGIPKAANDGPLDDGFGGTVDRRSNYSAFTRDVERFHQPHLEAFWQLTLSDRVELDQAFFAVKGEGYFDFDGTFRSASFLRLPAGVVPAGSEDEPLYISRPDVPLLFRAYLDQWQLGWLPSVTLRSRGGETVLGAEARLHRSLRWGRIESAPGLPPDKVGPEADARVYSVRGEKSILSAFASHLARPHPRVAVQADVQMTRRQYRIYDEEFFGNRFAKPYTFVNPRLGVTFNPEQPLRAYASLALAHREPRMKSLYDGEEAGAGFEPQFERRADGSFDTESPLVKSERLWDLEVGGSINRPRYRFSVNGFLMAFDDEIVPSGGLDQYGVPRTGNADRTRHAGIEVEGGIRLAPGVDLLGNATFSRNRFVRFTEFVSDGVLGSTEVRRDGNSIAGFPDRIVNAALSVQRSGVSATFNLAAVGRQFVDNGAGRDIAGEEHADLVVDPYAMVDVSIRYTPRAAGALGGVELTLDINNLTNRKALLFGNAGFGAPQFFPSATRHIFAGVRYTVR